MTARIITYHSLNNSDPEQQWMGFVEVNRNRLGIWFPGATEDEVKEKVRKFWRAEQEKRELAAAAAAKRADAMRSARQRPGDTGETPQP